MPTLNVIKNFDVIKNIAVGFFPCSVDLFIYPFAFQKTGKSFLQPHYHDNYRDGPCCPPGRVISGTTTTHGLCTDCPDPNEPAPVFRVYAAKQPSAVRSGQCPSSTGIAWTSVMLRGNHIDRTILVNIGESIVSVVSAVIVSGVKVLTRVLLEGAEVLTTVIPGI